MACHCRLLSVFLHITVIIVHPDGGEADHFALNVRELAGK
ncbi:Hypothetical protein Cul05146_0175 [Corynebacterium ulcerans]|nr:Hypothetical protein Cul05146_0175 [Corynebacterium ulcerans]AKA95722.1 Hypothetical protein CUL131002_0165 [Corynebacterium ulcerans]